MKETSRKIFFSLQRYLQVDLKYIFKGSFWLTLGRLFSITSSLALAIIVANYVPPEVYGHYNYAVSIIGILTVFSLLGIGEAVTLAVARGHEGSIVPALITKMRWSILGSIIAASASGYYYFANNTNLAGLLLLSALALPFFQTPQLFNGLLTGRKLFRQLAVIQTICSVITSVVLGITFYLTNDVLTLFAIFLGSYMGVRWVSAWYIFKTYRPNNETEGGTISFGKHLSVMRIVNHISNHLDSILVWQFVGAGPLAVYSFATKIPNELFESVKGLQTLAMPKFASADTSTLKRTLPNKALKLLVIMIVLVGIYILIAPFIFHTLFPLYTDAIFYSQLFALTFLFLPKNFFYQLLISKGSTKHLYIVANSTQILQLLLIGTLAYQFQIIGIIIARILALIYNTTITLYYFKKL